MSKLVGRERKDSSSSSNSSSSSSSSSSNSEQNDETDGLNSASKFRQMQEEAQQESIQER